MEKIIETVLDKLEEKGFESYIVGGYVRDMLLGILSYDIDICTNAKPRELLNIFPNASSKNLGGISFKIKEYNFELTTYRQEFKYEKRKPVEFVYINNLVDDLKRRDFTINSICMNKKGEIIDLLNGEDDLSNLTIRMIGDPDKKIKEDPLRILRAIRFATILNFQIEENLYEVINRNGNLIFKLSKTRIKEELDKILLSDNVLYGLELLNNLKIGGTINISEIVPVKSLEGMYAQLNIDNLPFTKEEKKNIATIKKIILKGDIDINTLYNNGLYLSIIAGEILKIDKSVINKMYNKMPIKDRTQLDIKAADLELLGIVNDKISKTFNLIEKEVLKGKLENRKDNILEFIKKR